MSDFKQELIETGDFLSLTLSHEWAISPFSFKVIDKSKQTLVVSVQDTGIILFEPKSLKKNCDNKHIVISCGVHGNETAPIELCASFIKQLILGEIALKHRVLFIFGNPPAINANRRFIDENLNSLFSGAYYLDPGIINFERKRAMTLENVIRAFYTDIGFYDESTKAERYHYDLHTAIRGSKYTKFAISPFLHGKKVDKAQLAILDKSGIEALLFVNTPTNTLSYFSAQQFNAHSFTLELGKAKPFGENNHDDIAKFYGVLTQLFTHDVFTLASNEKQSIVLFDISRRINKQSENFTFHFANDIENFTTFEQGTLLATDGETPYVSEDDNEAILFPQSTFS